MLALRDEESSYHPCASQRFRSFPEIILLPLRVPTPQNRISSRESPKSLQLPHLYPRRSNTHINPLLPHSRISTSATGLSSTPKNQNPALLLHQRHVPLRCLNNSNLLVDVP